MNQHTMTVGLISLVTLWGRADATAPPLDPSERINSGTQALNQVRLDLSVQWIADGAISPSELIEGVPVEFVFPSGVREIAMIEHTTIWKDRGVVARGHFPGTPLASFVLVNVGGRIAGGIWHSEQGTFDIQPRAGLVSMVKLYGDNDVFECGFGSHASDLAAGGEQHHGESMPGSPGASQVSAPLRGTQEPCGCAEDGTEIDVLLAYTPQARDVNGGIAGIEALCLAAAESMNIGFENSLVTETRLVVVDIVLTAYEETLGDIIAESRALRDPSDGIMDELHATRDDLSADVVTLIRSTQTGNFVGGNSFYAVGNQANAFSVNASNVAVGLFVVAHELGHHFASTHNYPNVGDWADQHFGYGNNFFVNSAQYWTIMSYGPGTVLPLFTTPDVSHLGVPVGRHRDLQDGLDNAEIMRRGASAMANFRFREGTIVDCNDNGRDDAEDIALGTSLDANENGLPDECEVRLYVDQSALGGGDGLSWETAYDDLSDAIGFPRYQCSYVTEVWVGEGTHVPSGPHTGRQDRFWLAPKMRILGGFAGHETDESQRDSRLHPTILSGDRFGDDQPGQLNRDENSGRVVEVVRGNTTSARLDGFTILGGNARTSGVADPVAGNLVMGGGVFAWEGGVSLIDCEITDNAAQFWGGGVLLGPASGGFLIEDCRIHGNNRVQTNQARGGGVHIRNTDGQIDNTRFSLNSGTRGGGLYATSGSNIAITNSLFDANDAGSGGGINLERSIDLSVVNSTFRDNIARGIGGAINMNSNTPLGLHNVVMWGNTGVRGGAVYGGDSVQSLPASVITVSYSDVQEGQGDGIFLAGRTVLDWGLGNIDVDPLFESAESSALGAGSPSIDAADNSQVPDGVTTDLAGQPRFVDDPATDDTGAGSAPIVDMGAYEFQVECVADLTGDGVIDSEDFFLYLDLFVVGDARADINGDGNIDSDDFFAYLDAFVAGCG